MANLDRGVVEGLSRGAEEAAARHETASGLMKWVYRSSAVGLSLTLFCAIFAAANG
ncbi:MAG: hypothetical protein AAB955_03860 [Patescibacteria group bacterium]